MESATILMSPSTGLSGILHSYWTQYSRRTRIWKYINTISMHGEKFYQLHTETETAVKPLNNLEKRILFVPMNFLSHVERIIMALSILYCKLKFLTIYIFLSKGCFYLTKQCRTWSWWAAVLCGIPSGPSLFAKGPVIRCPEWKVLLQHPGL